MASSLNADNGVVSGSAGLKSAADSSGVLALQSNGTTGLTLNTSLALGVGSGNSTGSSGQVLTSAGSGAAPAWSTLAVTGSGGQTATGNLTLTSSSAAAITITPASPGLYVTLPDATTCTKSTNLFSIYNAGEYDYGVKDSTGTQLGWVRAETGAVIGLSDNSTAAGGWALYGLEKTGITAIYSNPTIAGMTTGGGGPRIALDANRTCFVFGYSSCYAVVYDASSQTWGSPVLIRASLTGYFFAVNSGTDQVLVVSNSNTTAMEAVTLTISGTSVTVNSGTKATATLAGNINGGGELVAVGSSFVLSYNRAANVTAIRAFSISGTTPTIGAETVVNASTSSIGYIALFPSGSVLRAVYFYGGGSASQGFWCASYSVSGSTFTFNNEVSGFTSASVQATVRSFLNGSGNIVCEYSDGSSHWATIFKLTGTSMSSSTVSLGNIPNNIINTADYVNVTSTKTVFFYANSTTWYANILTDTSGTASAGTELTAGSGGTISQLCGLSASGNLARFSYSAGSSLGQITLDCSGSSPVISSGIYRPLTPSSTSVSVPVASNKYGVRNYRVLTAGTSAVLTAETNTAFDVLLLPNSIQRTIPPPYMVSLSGGLVGASNSESWFASCVATSAATGYVFNRVEIAA